jgi:hypothetical protein
MIRQTAAPPKKDRNATAVTGTARAMTYIYSGNVYGRPR